MRASEIQAVKPDLFFWQAYEPAVKCDLSCCARRIGGELILIDPIEVTDTALDELVAYGQPSAIVLTSANHARAAAAWRDQFSIPIHAHAAAGAELEIAVGGRLAEGDRFRGVLEVIELPGAATGEIALCADGMMHVGDALIHLESTGLALLPAKYCADARVLQRSLGKLLRFDFEVLTFAHGLPLVSAARHRLETLLA